MVILETERLYLREMEQTDYTALCRILQDKQVMYAYEHAFDNDEVQEWLDNQIRRYDHDGFGLWAAVLRETDEMIGQCGLTIRTVMVSRCWRSDIFFKSSIGTKDMPWKRQLHAENMRLTLWVQARCFPSYVIPILHHKMLQNVMA